MSNSSGESGPNEVVLCARITYAAPYDYFQPYYDDSLAPDDFNYPYSSPVAGSSYPQLPLPSPETSRNADRTECQLPGRPCLWCALFALVRSKPELAPTLREVVRRLTGVPNCPIEYFLECLPAKSGKIMFAYYYEETFCC